MQLVTLVNVYCPPLVAGKARVEDTRRVGEAAPVVLRDIHLAVVGVPHRDNPVVLPNRRASPLPFLHHLGVGLVEQPPDVGQSLSPSVLQRRDSVVDLLRGSPMVLWLRGISVCGFRRASGGLCPHSMGEMTG